MGDMLVCNVSSLRAPIEITVEIAEAIEANDVAPGHIVGIAIEIAEAVEAVDETSTGVIFDTLVDDPASADDIVDAYLGELMVEAASAADTVQAGLSFVAAIVEDLTAIAAEDGAVPAVYTDAIDETVTAADVIDASTVLGAAVTTMGRATLLAEIDTTLPSASLTIIDVGR